MKDLKVTNVAGQVPLDLVARTELEEVVENLVILMRTTGATGITADIEAEGKITMAITDLNGGMHSITMEAEEL